MELSEYVNDIYHAIFITQIHSKRVILTLENPFSDFTFQLANYKR